MLDVIPVEKVDEVQVNRTKEYRHSRTLCLFEDVVDVGFLRDFFPQRINTNKGIAIVSACKFGRCSEASWIPKGGTIVVQITVELLLHQLYHFGIVDEISIGGFILLMKVMIGTLLV